MKELKINFSTDDAKLPVGIRFERRRANFEPTLATVSNVVPAPVEPTPDAIPVR